jgi:hypothetical protein
MSPELISPNIRKFQAYTEPEYLQSERKSREHELKK